MGEANERHFTFHGDDIGEQLSVTSARRVSELVILCAFIKYFIQIDLEQWRTGTKFGGEDNKVCHQFLFEIFLPTTGLQLQGLESKDDEEKLKRRLHAVETEVRFSLISPHAIIKVLHLNPGLRVCP